MEEWKRTWQLPCRVYRAVLGYRAGKEGMEKNMECEMPWGVGLGLL